MPDLQPALDRLDGIPRALSFSVSGPWAHFRQIDGNSVRRTYRAPPRTTVAGLIAAILGLPRDSYYELFGSDSSAIAITPESELRVKSLAENILTTSHEGMKRVGANRKGLKLSMIDATKPRQQQNFEVLADPSYRIDVFIDDDEVYEDLRTHLQQGTAVYTPALGLSEFLATIEYHGEFEPQRVESDGSTEVQSTIPGGTGNLVPTPDTTTTIERTPALMETTDPSGPHGPGRRTTAYADIVVEREGNPLKTIAPVSTVGERNVVFL